MPWPEAADGDGYSLVLIDPASNPDHAIASNWRSSTLPGGNPGSSDATAFVGDPSVDDDGDGLNALMEHALGTSDSVANPSPLTIGANSDGAALISYTRNLSADDVVYSVESSSDLHTWNTLDPGIYLESETPMGDGTSVVTWQYTPTGDSRIFVRLSVGSR